MATLNGALLSMGASGQVGKTLVIGKWRGIPYARQYVIPANPRTAAQQAVRNRFSFFGAVLKLLPASLQAAFDAFATGQKFTGGNQFIGKNVSATSGEVDLQAMIVSPGARGGLPPQSVTATSGSLSGEIDVTMVVPDSLPAGWSITNMHVAAIKDQDPTGTFTGQVHAGATDVAPWTVTLDGLEAGTQYVAFGFIEYLRPDGKEAYSISLSDIASATA